jgi:predicted esterase
MCHQSIPNSANAPLRAHKQACRTSGQDRQCISILGFSQAWIGAESQGRYVFLLAHLPLFSPMTATPVNIFSIV